MSVVYVPEMATRCGVTVADYWLQCERQWRDGTLGAGCDHVVRQEEAAWCHRRAVEAGHRDPPKRQVRRSTSVK
jgi:hypothetical protein